MNRQIESIEILSKELEGINHLKRVAFAASCCERLLPNYNLFTREEKVGHPSVIRNALDEVWQVVQGKPIDVFKIEQFHDSCLAEISFQENKVFKFGHDYEAQLAVIAISYALESCLEIINTPLVISIVNHVRDTIYEFLMVMSDEHGTRHLLDQSFEEQCKEISKHPFTLRELEKESEDLQRLKEIEHLDSKFIEWLRNSFNNDGKSVIDLG